MPVIAPPIFNLLLTLSRSASEHDNANHDSHAYLLVEEQKAKEEKSDQGYNANCFQLKTLIVHEKLKIFKHRGQGIRFESGQIFWTYRWSLRYTCAIDLEWTRVQRRGKWKASLSGTEVEGLTHVPVNHWIVHHLSNTGISISTGIYSLEDTRTRLATSIRCRDFFSGA